MKAFKAQVISRSKDGIRAMVVVMLEIDDKKLSSTRHVVHDKYGWTGANPDPRAIAANEAIVEHVAMSRANLARAASKLAKLEEAAEPDEEAIAKAKDIIASAEVNLAAAIKAEGETQSEFPLMVAFDIA